MLSRAEFLQRSGYSVLLIDFQAHGESTGQHSTFGDLESRDVVAALELLRLELPGERLGVIGVSLGAAAFVLAEGRPKVDAAVLESMYPTIARLAGGSSLCTKGVKLLPRAKCFRWVLLRHRGPDPISSVDPQSLAQIVPGDQPPKFPFGALPDPDLPNPALPDDPDVQTCSFHCSGG
jgi:pimeloyl-ACP methyl ester carboxylesterase